jgi:hypothetical protein
MLRKINFKTWMTISAFLLALCGSTYAGRTIYVDADANGTNDGSSWADAYNYLQDTLADANSSTKPVEIRVAQGVYKPDQGVGITPGDRTATFQLINGITIKGGYAGLGEPDPNARDIDKYQTILSGDLDGNDVDVNNPAELEYEPTRSENSYHVINSSKTNRSAVLEGFTISAGNASVKPFDPTLGFAPDGVGGGMANFSGGGPSLINCSFIRNSACQSGGGFFSRGYPVLTDCTFVENYALAEGGGAIGSDSDGMELRGCVFTRNWARSGGGIYGWVERGATLINCTFSENLAEDAGGGGLRIGCRSESRLFNCLFERNRARYGGGVASDFSKFAFVECNFDGNIAEFGGGVLNLGGVILVNCILSGNIADSGGAVGSFSSDATLTNCTFSGNRATRGNALLCDGYRHKYPINIEINSCILWDGGGEIWNNDGSPLATSYSDIRGGRIAVHDPCDAVTWGPCNIDADPLFADANNQDYHLKSQAGRWDPLIAGWIKDDVTSPCIDAGDPASPIGLEPFPNGGIINMGAYGGTAEASKSYFGEPVCETIVAGDINGDCKVDFKDFALMAFHWLEER